MDGLAHARAIARLGERARCANLAEQWINDCDCEKDGWHDCYTCDVLRHVIDEMLERE